MMSPGHSVPRRGIRRADQLMKFGLTACVLATFFVAMWTLWLAGQFGAVLTFSGWPDSSPADGPGILIRLLNHTGQPALAWPAAARADIPAAGVVYVLWIFLFLVHVLVVVVGGIKVVMKFGRRKGFATRKQLATLVTEKAVLAKVDIVRPGLTINESDPEDIRADKQARRLDPHEMGTFLGYDAQSGIPLYSPIEFAVLGEGVPRVANKTQRGVIPRVLEARGPVVTTSTRLDVAEVTIGARARIGPVNIFEPLGRIPGVPRLRWSPIHGAEDRAVAMVRGKGFAAGSGIGGKGVENGQWFEDQAAIIIRSLLHAAALDGNATMEDVLAWSQNAANPRAEQILRHHGARSWAEPLTRHRESSSRSRDIIAGVVAGALDSFNDPRVLAACSPPKDAAFNPQEWMTERGTLYLVGTSNVQASVAPLLATIVEDLLYVVREAALLSPGGRIEPNVRAELDEIRNTAPLPSLPSLMSEGPGSGISVGAWCQSSYQILERWGREGGKAIESASTTRLVFGGSMDADSQRDLQFLAGQVDELSETTSHGPGHGSEGYRRENLISIADMRTMPIGHALAYVGNLPPVEVKVPAWWERKDAALLTADRDAFRARIAAGEGR